MSRADEPLQTISAHGRHAQCVRFTADGGLLISVGLDAAVRFWSVPGFGAAGVLLGHKKSVNTISLAPGGRILSTSSSDGTVRIWSLTRRSGTDLVQGETLRTLPKQSEGRFSPDGRILATVNPGGRVVLWDTGTWEISTKLPALDRRVFTLAFDHDTQTLMVGGTGPIYRIALPQREIVSTLEGHAVAVPSLAFAPGGDILASTGADGTLRFWSSADWSELRRVNIGAAGIYRLAFTPGGDRIAVSADGLIQLFSVPGGELVRRIEIPLKGVYGVDISPNGCYLANAAADGKLRIWTLNGG